MQLKQHLLCSDCEQRFSRREDYVSRLVYQKDGCAPLLGMLDPEIRLPPTPRLCGASRLHLDDIGYFCVSIYWRALVISQCYETRVDDAEWMRRFLIGASDFPDKAALFLKFLDAGGTRSGFEGVCSLPSFEGADEHSVYTFQMFGLEPVMFIGDVPGDLVDYCVFRGVKKCVFVSDAHAAPVSDDMAKLAAWGIWSESGGPVRGPR
ncbi:hypothetical protein WMF38_19475 [Sorangium sp. So ce118]